MNKKTVLKICAYCLPFMLTLIFLALRLCDITNWSLFWVLSPLLFVTAISIIIHIILFICVVFIPLFHNKQKERDD